MLNPLWLKTFTAAAAAPSFTEAARRLGLTQPTVSEHIRQLEQSVNRRLFLRDTHSLVLTSDGRSLLVHAEIILDAHERAERLFDAPRLRGRVRLGTSDDLAMGPLPDVLAAFRLAHPEVELDLTIGVTSELYKLLDDNGLDVMIGKRRRGDRRGQTLHKEALLWRAKEGLRFAPDEPLPLILLREPSVTRTLTLDALARVGRSWQIVCTSTSYAGCQAAARAGLGITVQPSHLSTAGLAAPGGAIQLPALPQVEFIVISAPSPNKPTRALTEILMRSTLT
ncbi:MAG: LysR substrate-binding domain-containing protein [Achromobacter sp.]|jgi:DNA-binding transcriptional LysR family regulator|uniref:LysR substrate-binding domain-containing protein n=1 Tax=Achromobacter sp. TaxID=134375 RepID=UPI000F979BED